MVKQTICLECGSDLPSAKRKYCSSSCAKDVHTRQNTKWKRNRRNEIKRFMRDKAGNLAGQEVDVFFMGDRLFVNVGTFDERDLSVIIHKDEERIRQAVKLGLNRR